MNNQLTPAMSNVFEHLFVNKENHKHMWNHRRVSPEQLSGVYLYECDKGSRHGDFVVSYVLDHILLNASQSRKVSIFTYDYDIGTAEDIYNLINDYSMNGFIDVDMSQIVIVRNGLGIHNIKTETTIYFDFIPKNITDPIDLIVLDSENMAWSLINDNIIKTATGGYNSVTFFNDGMVMEDKRNPLYNMKMQKNVRYVPVCALDFAREDTKQFFTRNGLTDSIKVYPCAVKELLLSHV